MMDNLLILLGYIAIFGSAMLLAEILTRIFIKLTGIKL